MDGRRMRSGKSLYGWVKTRDAGEFDEVMTDKG